MNMQMMALSDRAWRVFTAALMLGAEQGTDGIIPKAAFRFLYPEDIPTSTLDELVAADLIFRNSDGGFSVRDWTKTQSAAAEVEHQRERNRAKTKAYRDRKKNGDVTGNKPGHTPRQGQARTGQDRTGSIEPREESSEPVTTWDVVQIPTGEAA